MIVLVCHAMPDALTLALVGEPRRTVFPVDGVGRLDFGGEFVPILAEYGERRTFYRRRSRVRDGAK